MPAPSLVISIAMWSQAVQAWQACSISCYHMTMCSWESQAQWACSLTCYLGICVQEVWLLIAGENGGVRGMLPNTVPGIFKCSVYL